MFVFGLLLSLLPSYFIVCFTLNHIAFHSFTCKKSSILQYFTGLFHTMTVHYKWWAPKVIYTNCSIYNLLFLFIFDVWFSILYIHFVVWENRPKFKSLFIDNLNIDSSRQFIPAQSKNGIGFCSNWFWHIHDYELFYRKR